MTSGSVYALPLVQASIHSSDIKTRCDPKQNFTRGRQVALINFVTISRFSVTALATCNLLADSAQQLIAILLRDNCSKTHTDFTVLSFPVYTVLYFQTLFLSFVFCLPSRPIFIPVAFCLLWYDTWSCGLSRFLLTKNMLCYEHAGTSFKFSPAVVNTRSVALLYTELCQLG